MIHRSIHEEQEKDCAESAKATAKDAQVEVTRFSGSEIKYNLSLESLGYRQSDGETDAKKNTQKLSDESSPGEAIQQENATHATDEKAPSTTADASDEKTTSEAAKTTSKKFRSNDPIHWYGILVSPSLRTAQKSFTDAIQNQIPELAGTIVEMRALEERIRRIRTELGSQKYPGQRFIV